MMRRSRAPGFVLLVLVLTALGPATAVAKDDRTWVRHRVLPGERLEEIANRYQVRKRAIIRWNKLNKRRPFLRAGERLRIYARATPPQREKLLYTVRRGDSWHRIAQRFDVEPRRLRHRWNRDAPRRLRAGQKVAVWVRPREPEPQDEPEAKRQASPDADPLPIIAVSDRGVSVGSPTRGRLIRGVRLPENERLYTVRKPEHAYGSSHTVVTLQRAIARFRQVSQYDGDLIISDLSRRRGGRLRPHSSHQSGRDVDIWLPRAPGSEGSKPVRRISAIDWDAAWQLIESLIETDEVKYIFLSRSRQRALRRAAKRAGETDSSLERLIQFPRRARTGIIRHSRGHTNHMHVRFRCAEHEKRCR